MNNKLKIIIPVYNSKWLNACISTIVNQTYEDWKAIIIDDASTDEETKRVVNEADRLYKGKITVVRNEENVGALTNIITGIQTISDDKEDVIILIDGDDWLATDRAFEIVNDSYQDRNIWMTYGQMNCLSGAIGGSCPFTNENFKGYRWRGKWFTTHLRTFRKKIWDKVKDEDLKDDNGKYYSAAWDLAILLPMIEMCGLKRIKFIEKILYIYNDLNPIGDTKIHNYEQITMAGQIRKKASYKEIEGDL